MNISSPLSSKYNMLEEVWRLNGKDVVSAVSLGRSLKVTVDNIDGRIIANQVHVKSLIISHMSNFFLFLFETLSEFF